jgi:hypothetical protein
MKSFGNAERRNLQSVAFVQTARWVTVWRSPLFLAAAIAGNALGIVRPFVRWAIGKLIRFHLT